MNYDSRHTFVELAPIPGTVTADDGRELTTTTYEPAGAVDGVVLIAGAMATPTSFYAAFARHLAERGFRTITFEYRGMGSVAEMKAETADADRWFADGRDVLAHVAAENPGLPITWIGHSLGGQMVPFVGPDRLAAILTVASGDGYWGRNAAGVKWIAPLLWWGIAPASMRVAGYFPGRRLRVLDDLPSGVMRQWSRWCRHPEYLRADHPDAPAQYDAVTAPLTSLSFTDDELMSAESITHLHDWYTSASQTRVRVDPADVGLRRIGHHGFFRTSSRDLWDELVVPHLAR